jgi:hypothetical protein
MLENPSDGVDEVGAVYAMLDDLSEAVEQMVAARELH